MYKAKDMFGSKETKLLSSVRPETRPSAPTWGERQGRGRASTRSSNSPKDSVQLKVGGGEKNKAH